MSQTPDQLLEQIYNSVLSFPKIELNKEQKEQIKLIANKAGHQKGVYTVLVTLLLYKILHPEQDIRLHQENMTGGFSGRSFDTKHVTPTLRKLALPCMAESGWLTRSLEQPYPYNLNYQGKISDTSVKNAFLRLLDYVESNANKAKAMLVYLLSCIYDDTLSNKIVISKISIDDSYDINSIVEFLTNCFNYNYKTSGGSKLPVIAFHCIFNQLISELKRYENCALKPLGSHTASDRTSKTAGDIEIFHNHQLIEAIEIKLNKPISSHMLLIVKDKIYQHNPRRYCIFSTADIIEPIEVYKIIDEIKEQHGCQVIVNGVIPTLKYYLRLIVSLENFMNDFLSKAENDSELKPIHKQTINQLLQDLLN